MRVPLSFRAFSTSAAVQSLTATPLRSLVFGAAIFPSLIQYWRVARATPMSCATSTVLSGFDLIDRKLSITLDTCQELFYALCVSDWQKLFEAYLKGDGVALRILAKLTKNGLPRQQVLGSLEGLTNPTAGRKSRAVFDCFAPTRSQNRKLATLCLKLQKKIENIYGSPIGTCFPQANEMLGLAGVLKSTAATISSTSNDKALSRFTEKRLWKGFPLAVLYAELGVPKMLSWEDWYSLYTIARLAHGVSTPAPEPRSLATNYRRFVNRNPGVMELAKKFADFHSNRYLRHDSHSQKSPFV